MQVGRLPHSWLLTLLRCPSLANTGVGRTSKCVIFDERILHEINILEKVDYFDYLLITKDIWDNAKEWVFLLVMVVGLSQIVNALTY